jgi:hypothetical protein
MKLKSFGCSFIFGSDLADDGRHLPIPTATPSNFTWPAYLARHLKYDYRCYAWPGIGNLQIAEQVLSHATDANDSMFVVGWTWIDRFDYTNSIISNSPRATQWPNWRTIRPGDNTELAKIYYHSLHTEYRDKLTTLMSIRLVIDTLKQKKIPFIMTYMDDLLFDQRWHTTPAVTDLQEYILPYMTRFEGQCFLNWSRKNNYPISEAWHPLEEAHAIAGDYIIKVFDTQKTNDPTQ